MIKEMIEPDPHQASILNPLGPRIDGLSHHVLSQENVSVDSNRSKKSDSPRKGILNVISKCHGDPQGLYELPNLMKANNNLEAKNFVVRNSSRKYSNNLDNKNKSIWQRLYLSRLFKMLRFGKLRFQKREKDSSLKDILFRKKIIKFIQILINQASIRDIKKPTGRAISLINDLSYEENSHPLHLDGVQTDKFRMGKPKGMVLII